MPYTPADHYATTEVLDRLKADVLLQSYVGMVLNRPPKRPGDGIRFATPSAFDADLRIQPTAYVTEATRGIGPNVLAIKQAVTDRVRIYFVGPSDEERKDKLRLAKTRVRRLLTRYDPDEVTDDCTYPPWYYRNEDGRKMFSRPEFIDSGFYTSEIFIGESALEGFMDFLFDGMTA